MAWEKKTEHIDKAQGKHYVFLHDPTTGAEHQLIIDIGHGVCPHCGHCKPKDNLEDLDPKAHIRAELEALTESHNNIEAYAKKHNVEIKRA